MPRRWNILPIVFVCLPLVVLASRWGMEVALKLAVVSIPVGLIVGAILALIESGFVRGALCGAVLGTLAVQASLYLSTLNGLANAVDQQVLRAAVLTWHIAGAIAGAWLGIQDKIPLPKRFSPAARTPGAPLWGVTIGAMVGMLAASLGVILIELLDGWMGAVVWNLTCGLTVITMGSIVGAMLGIVIETWLRSRRQSVAGA